jgi:hypothetical protein
MDYFASKNNCCNFDRDNFISYFPQRKKFTSYKNYRGTIETERRYFFQNRVAPVSASVDAYGHYLFHYSAV